MKLIDIYNNYLICPVCKNKADIYISIICEMPEPLDYKNITRNILKYKLRLFKNDQFIFDKLDDYNNSEQNFLNSINNGGNLIIDINNDIKSFPIYIIDTPKIKNYSMQVKCINGITQYKITEMFNICHYTLKFLDIMGDIDTLYETVEDKIYIRSFINYNNIIINKYDELASGQAAYCYFNFLANKLEFGWEPNLKNTTPISENIFNLLFDNLLKIEIDPFKLYNKCNNFIALL